MRKLALGIAIGLLASSTIAWAFTVKFPNTLKIRGSATVDEVGNVLGGATPLQVEVTNATPTEPCEHVTAIFDTGGNSVTSTPVMTVPAAKDLLVTDITFARRVGNDQVALQTQGNSNRLAFTASTAGPITLRTPVRFFEGDDIVLAPFGATFEVIGSIVGCLVPAA